MITGFLQGSAKCNTSLELSGTHFSEGKGEVRLGEGQLKVTDWEKDSLR